MPSCMKKKEVDPTVISPYCYCTSDVHTHGRSSQFKTLVPLVAGECNVVEILSVALS